MIRVNMIAYFTFSNIFTVMFPVDFTSIRKIIIIKKLVWNTYMKLFIINGGQFVISHCTAVIYKNSCGISLGNFSHLYFSVPCLL